MNLKKTAKVIFPIQLFLAVFLFAQNAYAEDKITNFESIIKVEKSGIIDVIEKITYDFSGNPSSEISRNIEKVLSNASEIGLKVSNVTDEKGNKYVFSESLENNTFHIQIRANDKPFEGVKNFVINYKVNYVISDYYNEDRLLWKTEGVNFGTPISQTKITVDLSELQNLDMNNVIIPNCYNISDCSISKKDFQVVYSGFRSGTDIQLFIPKGSINWPPEPPIEDTSLRDMAIPFAKLFLLMFLFKHLLSFLSRLNNPKKDIPWKLRKKPIITEYEPPIDLSPIDVGALLNRSVDANDLFSVVMDLAYRGYIKIEFIDGINFIKLKPGDDLVAPADKEIFKLLFEYRNAVSLKILKKSPEIFNDCLGRVTSQTEDYLCERGYMYNFGKSKFKKFELAISIFVMMVFFVMFFSFSALVTGFEQLSDLVTYSTTTILFIGSVSVFILTNYIYRKIINGLTDKGIESYAKILGFKQFLKTAEKDRLAFFNSPEAKPETFDKFLPYAMVLHVENEWSNIFKQIFNEERDTNNLRF